MPCNHVWGIFYDPIVIGKPTCFSPAPVEQSFVRFCQKCRVVQRINLATPEAEWTIEDKISKEEANEFIEHREEEKLQGRIEWDV